MHNGRMAKSATNWKLWAIVGGLAVASLGTGAAVVAVKRRGGLAATYARIRAKFGDPPVTDAGGGRVTIAPAWIKANIVPVKLHTGHTVKMHRLVAQDFAQAFQAACKASGWTPKSVQTWVPRRLNWSPGGPLSLHTWGIAVDLDPPDNARTHKGRQTLAAHPEFVRTMEAAGWIWGGRWGKDFDPMHFQKTV